MLLLYYFIVKQPYSCACFEKNKGIRKRHFRRTGWSKLGFYIPFKSKGHIGTGPKQCHLWELNTHRGDCL